MNQLGSKILETPRLLLRPFRASDAEQAFANWMSDSAVTRFLTWEPHSDLSFTRELLALWEEEAQSPETYHWAIVWKENGEAAGDISVVAADMRSESAAVGYCLSRALWGKGVMTEALSRVVEYLFGEVGFYRIEAKHAAENAASGRVMEKCGFQKEGVLRAAYRLLGTGERVDLAVRAVLRPEWEQRSAK